MTNILIGKGLSKVASAHCPHCGLIDSRKTVAEVRKNIDGNVNTIFRHEKCAAQVAFSLKSLI